MGGTSCLEAASPLLAICGVILNLLMMLDRYYIGGHLFFLSFPLCAFLYLCGSLTGLAARRTTAGKSALALCLGGAVLLHFAYH